MQSENNCWGVPRKNCLACSVSEFYYTTCKILVCLSCLIVDTSWHYFCQGEKWKLSVLHHEILDPDSSHGIKLVLKQI